MRLSLSILVSAGLLLCACSSSQPRYHLSAAMHVDGEGWQSAVERVNRSDAYDVSIDSSASNRLFDRMDDHEICIGPRLVESGENGLGVLPLYCGEVRGNRSDSLQKNLNAYEAGLIQQKNGESEAMFRARVLEMSSTDNPVCYSVYPLMFAASSLNSPMIEESWLIACARKIDGNGQVGSIPSAKLASWLRVEASLLSGQNAYIADVFSRIAKDRSFEGEIYAKSLEGYTEVRAGKWHQAELTLLDAIEKSDRYGFWMLSRQNAIRLYMAISKSENLDGKRLELATRSIAPSKTGDERVAQFRHYLLMSMCQESLLQPDVTPGFVALCLPWLESSLENHDFDMALFLIEHSVNNAPIGGPAFDASVLHWLSSLELSEELAEIRHIFGQRMSQSENISGEEREILLQF